MPAGPADALAGEGDPAGTECLVQLEVQRAIAKTGPWRYERNGVPVTCQPYVWVELDDKDLLAERLRNGDAFEQATSFDLLVERLDAHGRKTAKMPRLGSERLIPGMTLRGNRRHEHGRRPSPRRGGIAHSSPAPSASVALHSFFKNTAKPLGPSTVRDVTPVLARCRQTPAAPR